MPLCGEREFVWSNDVLFFVCVSVCMCTRCFSIPCRRNPFDRRIVRCIVPSAIEYVRYSTVKLRDLWENPEFDGISCNYKYQRTSNFPTFPSEGAIESALDTAVGAYGSVRAGVLLASY